VANLIITDPSDQQMAKAKALWALHNPRKADLGPMPNDVNTSASRRMFEKHERERPLRPAEIAKIRFIPWDTVAKTLSGLNPNISFTSLPDAKIAIGFRVPSKKEVRDWETAGLGASEREEVKALGKHEGPRPFLVAASRGFVSPYTALLTDTPPIQVICRSLKQILAVLIAHGGFTWAEAERAFGFRLLGPGTETKREHVPCASPRIWAEDRPSCKVD
jgi:hypothetical protein